MLSSTQHIISQPWYFYQICLTGCKMKMLQGAILHGKHVIKQNVLPNFLFLLHTFNKSEKKFAIYTFYRNFKSFGSPLSKTLHRRAETFNWVFNYNIISFNHFKPLLVISSWFVSRPVIYIFVTFALYNTETEKSQIYDHMNYYLLMSYTISNKSTYSKTQPSMKSFYFPWNSNTLLGHIAVIPLKETHSSAHSMLSMMILQTGVSHLKYNFAWGMGGGSEG